MTPAPFEVRVPGKWILAGEHSVLRGSPALVFPLKSRFLELQFLPTPVGALHLELAGEHGKEFEKVLLQVLDRACAMTGVQRSDFYGTLKMSSSIPIGAGLGASGALCVAIGRWFQSLGLVSESEVYEFSRKLENLFHGESSGVDIAVALSGEGIRFLRSGDRQAVEMKWTPRWYVSYSGKRGVTLDCVNKVKALIARDPVLGSAIDEDMRRSVEMAQTALSSEDASVGLVELKKALDLARSCFDRWGLTPVEHLQWLESQGAYAVKPTGSGNGGYVLSLWKSEPSAEALRVLIPCS